MAWSEEDWLIIDSVLNTIAKSLRRIEREERQQKQQKREIPPAFSGSSNASIEAEERTKSAP